MSDEIPFKRPSRLRYFWWRNYFSENPASVLSKDERAFYSRDGYIQAQPDYRSDPFWKTDTTYWYLCCHDLHFRGPIYLGNSSNNSGDGAVIIIVFILALIALVIACALVFQFPPILIFSWVVLVISSVSETIVDGNSV